MKVIIVSIMMLGVVVFSSPARGESGRYDQLQFEPRQQPAQIDPALSDAERADACNEAKSRAIISLLRQHNRRLDEAAAREITEFIMLACERYGQEPFLIAALMVHESSARPDAVSRGGDYGLMQVRWRVHQRNIRAKYPHITTARDMLDPKYNILIGTEIFSTYRRTANNDILGALRYYTGGSTRMPARVFASVSRLEDIYMNYLENI